MALPKTEIERKMRNAERDPATWDRANELEADMETNETPEETAMRAYLNSMIEAGWRIEHQSWPPHTPDATDAEIAASTVRKTCDADDVIAVIRERTASTFDFIDPGGNSGGSFCVNASIIGRLG